MGATATTRYLPALQLVAAVALLLLWCAPPPASADVVCDESDKAILLELKTALGNPNNLKSWNSSTDCCAEWGSMECDNGGRVTVVDIQSTNATGRIPDFIGRLTYLERLVIRKCPNLTGPIPGSITDLSNLRELALERNNLTGSIPTAIDRLHNLVFLSLSQNNLAGPIPDSIGALDYLDDLYLDSNQLTGPVPASFESLDLERVNVAFNRLSGDAIPLFGGWKRTKAMDISGNLFDFNLTDVEFPAGLTIFNMSDNRIEGSIPTEADDLVGLTQFNVSHNRLCGEIPQGGVINQFDASAFAYNVFLCGQPLPPCPATWDCTDPPQLAGLLPISPVEVSR